MDSAPNVLQPAVPALRPWIRPAFERIPLQEAGGGGGGAADLADSS